MSENRQPGIPSNLKRIMLERGISIRKLSDMTADLPGGRVAGTQIQAVRNGKSCTTSVIRRIADALRMDPEVLFRDCAKPEPPECDPPQPQPDPQSTQSGDDEPEPAKDDGDVGP